MLPGHEQHVTGQERPSIEEGDARWIVEDDLGRRLATDDGAEGTPATARTIGRLERDVEDHGGPALPFLARSFSLLAVIGERAHHDASGRGVHGDDDVWVAWEEDVRAAIVRRYDEHMVDAGLH
jgi:hypothetical protein